MKALWVFARDFFSPFEIIYLAIAVTTFDHTAWGSAFLFEGAVVDSWVWWFKGDLMAFAIDVGMVFISKFLQNASNWKEVLSLSVSFVVASIISFYFQMVYIYSHTPTVPRGDGVTNYWQTVLTPILDARVVWLPFALPLLATIITISRIYRHKVSVYNKKPEIIIQTTGNSNDDLTLLIETVATAPAELPAGKSIIELPTAKADLKALTWWSEALGKDYGPYQTRNRMLAGMRRAQAARLLPATIEEPNRE